MDKETALGYIRSLPEGGEWEVRSFQDGWWHVETESTASVIRTIAEAWRQHLQGKKIALWVDGELIVY